MFNLKEIAAKFKKSGFFRAGKKIVLGGFLFFVSATASGQQNKLSSNDKTLAKAEIAARPDAAEMLEQINAYVEERSDSYASGVAENAKNNITTVRDGKHKRNLRAALNKVSNKADIGKLNGRFYCAGASMTTLLETIASRGLVEYAFLKCIENPHSCPSVIKKLDELYDNSCKSNNMRATIRHQFDANPNSVLVCMVNSPENSSSGKHMVIVTKDTAIDTTGVETPEGLVYGFNSEIIKNYNEYFVGKRNIRGKVYNLTALAEDILKEKMIALYFAGQLTLADLKKIRQHDKKSGYFTNLDNLCKTDKSTRQQPNYSPNSITSNQNERF